MQESSGRNLPPEPNGDLELKSIASDILNPVCLVLYIPINCRSVISLEVILSSYFSNHAWATFSDI
jgi:hypothetical protein